MTEATLDALLLRLTGDIVAAHTARNETTGGALTRLIGSVHNALRTVGDKAQRVDHQRELVAPLHASIFPEYLICLEDGRKLKMLKRHLLTAYNLSPDEYRRKWSLPPSYPMVAPNYALLRSHLAIGNGFGRKPPSLKFRQREDALPSVRSS
jgi:predicted transcriptional regulator